MAVLLALASSMAVDLCLANRWLFRVEIGGENGLNGSFGSSVSSERDYPSSEWSSPVVSPGLNNNQRIIQFLLHFFVIVLWLAVSVCIVEGAVYGTKRGTLWVCNEMMREILRGKMERHKYVSSGLEMAQKAHCDRARSNVKGTL
jgi:hypothetical protein